MISKKLDVIGAKLDELLRGVPPKPLPEKSQVVAHNEPQHRPSAHGRSLSSRSPEELEALAFGSSTSGEAQVQTNPVKHPTLGSL